MRIVRESTGSASVTLYDFEPTPDRICDDVARGLSARPKKLQPKYFYDERGALLFERITQLEAYYPTRTEIGILRADGSEIANRLGPRVRLLEFGSGSGEKTRILLRHLENPAAYVPIDISRAQLVAFALSVAAEFPGLEVLPICADYTSELVLPPGDTPEGRSVAFFPGSTIGNFEPDDAERFLRRVRRLVGPDGGLLIGLDLLKDRELIERAYNDPEGVTAEFNLNLLARINRECSADFDLEAFHHHAFFDTEERRVEMRLISDRRQVVTLLRDPEVSAPVRIDFEPGEFVTTEYSHKFDLDSFELRSARAGWRTEGVWTDPDRWFAVVLLG